MNASLAQVHPAILAQVGPANLGQDFGQNGHKAKVREREKRTGKRKRERERETRGITYRMPHGSHIRRMPQGSYILSASRDLPAKNAIKGLTY